jgi:hypothetical protein
MAVAAAFAAAVAACSAFTGNDNGSGSQADASMDAPMMSVDAPTPIAPDGSTQVDEGGGTPSDAGLDFSAIDANAAFPLPPVPIDCKNYSGAVFCDDFEGVANSPYGFDNTAGPGDIIPIIGQGPNGASTTVAKVSVTTVGDGGDFATTLDKQLSLPSNVAEVMIDYDFQVNQQSLTYATFGMATFADTTRQAFGVGGFPGTLGQLEVPGNSTTLPDMGQWHHARSYVSIKDGLGFTVIDTTLVQRVVGRIPLSASLQIGVFECGPSADKLVTTDVTFDNVLVRAK